MEVQFRSGPAGRGNAARWAARPIVKGEEEDVLRTKWCSRYDVVKNKMV